MAARRINLADPEFEPTDEELQELSHQAFADVPRRNAEALARLNAEIEVHRKKVVAYLSTLRLKP